MKLESYDNKDGYRIGLNGTERKIILERCDDENLRKAWIVTAYSGLRLNGAMGVRYKDIYERETGDYVIRVYERNSKNNQYRETPIPEKFAIELRTIAKSNPDIEKSDKIINCSKRTLNRKLNNMLNNLVDENVIDDMIIYLTFHDGRRTFINQMLDKNISPLQVMEWSGHDDWQTFRDHYMNDFSEQHQSEELSKTEIY